MAASAPVRKYTAADVEAMDDPVRWELADGCLVERSLGNESSAIALLVAYALQRFLHGKRLGFLLGADQIVHLFPDRPNSFRRPDVSYFRKDRLPEGKLPKGALFLAPDLVVEVVSPNDLAEALEAKVREHLQAGVQLVWVVYPETRTVTVWRQDGTCTPLSEDGALSGEQVIPGFECKVGEIFPED